LVKPNTAKWLPTEVTEGTAAWNRANKSMPVHDINDAQNGELRQSAAEAASALRRKRELAKLKVKENPRINPEEY